jgi:hypothetical protein
MSEQYVRKYVRRRKHELGLAASEVVPQTYHWGQEAQDYWYEATANLAGAPQKLYFFSMRSMASGDALHRAYTHATQQAVLAAWVRAATFARGCESFVSPWVTHLACRNANPAPSLAATVLYHSANSVVAVNRLAAYRQTITAEDVVLRLTRPNGETVWSWDDTSVCGQLYKTKCAVDDLRSTSPVYPKY